MKPTFKAPGSKRSKLKYDQLLSHVAFNCTLRRHINVNGGSAGSTVIYSVTVPPGSR
jgi:hypothetical protein